MKFSVITVTLNSSVVLLGTLSSVADQSLQTIEHIVIDGASKDNTDELIKLHGSNFVKYISESDLGIYDAMNKGLKLATGEVVCFLNAGDYYVDSGILELVDRIMTSEGLDIIYGDVAYFRDDNKHKIIRHYRSRFFHPRLLDRGFMPAHPAFFMRRDAYQRIEPFRINYKIAGDFEMMIRIFRDNNFRFRYVQEVLVLMRLGGISNKGLKSLIILNLEILRACRENGVKTNILKVLTRYPPKIIDFLDNMFRNKFY